MYTLERVVCPAFLCLFFSAVACAASAVAPGQCEAEAGYLDFLQSRGAPYSPNQDFSCFKNLADIDADDYLLVDVRPPEAFRGVHIPGSVNLLPLKLLATTTLSDKKLLIVNKGFDVSELAQLCASAKHRGFDKLRVLNEGIAGWAASGRSLEGNREAIADIDLLSASEFLAGLEFGHTSVMTTHRFLPFFREHAPPDTPISELDLSKNIESQVFDNFLNNSSVQPLRIVLLGDLNEEDIQRPKLRQVFRLVTSSGSLFQEYNRLRLIAGQRDAIPKRFLCGG
ncbi:rhodanese-like domain-containing protein [Marinobacter sp. C2H3]|uniref:rhodanese-like domain-containing protein n=1 Tax=Marinobacter sp. C2H3 TaxID=3119003 RepID=UPI00300E8CF7